ncbi:MAG: MFS transporter [Rhodospirillaceae bacterium]|nr:MFS transporter [Rhodospirillaceae bacterium]
MSHPVQPSENVAPAATAAPAGGAYAWYVVGVLVIAYTVSFIDRTILTLMVGPIRKSLEISDLQLSLLHGLAFAIFYTTLGIPMARYADSHNRTRLISAGIFFWSFMTALCGLARNFFQMFMARVGVGIGEAALSPAAYSIIADYFPPHKLTRALSVYSASIYIGTGVAMIAGGAIISMVPAMTLPGIGYMEPWRVVFLAVGLPGIFVVMLMATVREPPRTGLTARFSAGKAVPIRQVLAFIGERRAAYGLIIVGFSVKGMLWNGVTAWLPTFFARTYGWEPGKIGLYYGLAVIVFGTSGILTGGWISGRLRARGMTDANIWAGIAAALLMLPFGAVAPLMPTGEIALAVFCVFIFFASYPIGSAAAAIQEITPNQLRAQMSAIYLLGSNLIGIGLGPSVVAAFTDLVFQDDNMLRYSITAMCLFAAPVGALLLWLGLKPYRAAMANAR